MNGLLYCISLRDKFNRLHTIELVGLEKLSSVYPEVKIKSLRSKLPSKFHDVTEKKLGRSEGELDILIGTDLACLHPRTVYNIEDKLSLMESVFGSGYTLMGYDEKFVEYSSDLLGVNVNCWAVVDKKISFSMDPNISSNAASTTKGIILAPKGYPVPF